MSNIEEAFAFLRAAYKVEPHGILQVGAHAGQESLLYVSHGIKTAVFVEPIPEVFKRLEENIAKEPEYTAVNAVCSSQSGLEVEFNVASNEESSSLLPLGRHGAAFPHIKYDKVLQLHTTTIDDIIIAGKSSVVLDMLVLDVQGAEMNVLRGGTRFIETCRAMFLEVSEEPLYEGGCTLEDIMAFLRPLGFGLKWLKMSQWKTGDALFVRNG